MIKILAVFFSSYIISFAILASDTIRVNIATNEGNIVYEMGNRYLLLIEKPENSVFSIIDDSNPSINFYGMQISTSTKCSRINNSFEFTDNVGDAKITLFNGEILKLYELMQEKEKEEIEELRRLLKEGEWKEIFDFIAQASESLKTYAIDTILNSKLPEDLYRQNIIALKLLGHKKDSEKVEFISILKEKGVLNNFDKKLFTTLIEIINETKIDFRMDLISALAKTAIFDSPFDIKEAEEFIIKILDRVLDNKADFIMALKKTNVFENFSYDQNRTNQIVQKILGSTKESEKSDVINALAKCKLYFTRHEINNSNNDEKNIKSEKPTKKEAPKPSQNQTNNQNNNEFKNTNNNNNFRDPRDIFSQFFGPKSHFFGNEREQEASPDLIRTILKAPDSYKVELISYAIKTGQTINAQDAMRIYNSTKDFKENFIKTGLFDGSFNSDLYRQILKATPEEQKLEIMNILDVRYSKR